MIKIVEGDLLNSDADIIAHQVNCSNAMNSGVAKQIREKYPEVFRAYQNLYKFPEGKNKHDLLGRCQIVKTHDGKYIANLFGQLGYGYDGKQYTNLQALKKAMMALRDSHLTKDKSVAFPWGLASVRGGAKWEDVYAIIEEVFEGYNVEIWKWDRG